MRIQIRLKNMNMFNIYKLQYFEKLKSDIKKYYNIG